MCPCSQMLPSELHPSSDLSCHPGPRRWPPSARRPLVPTSFISVLHWSFPWRDDPSGSDSALTARAKSKSKRVPEESIWD